MNKNTKAAALTRARYFLGIATKKGLFTENLIKLVARLEREVN